MGHALITGGAMRIGKAIALDLAKSGMNATIHYRDSAESARALADAICASGSRAATLAGDLADWDTVQNLVARAEDLLGPVTCLVNNASLFRRDDFANMTREGWDEHFAVNLEAPVFLSRQMAARLPAGLNGVIVNVIDQRVHRVGADFFSYTLSKSALMTATRMLAQALAPRIRVNAVAPGPVLQSIHQSPEDFEAEARSTLLGHGVAPEDIAAAVRYLVT
ncbi:MAG: hypothetical protein RLZ98_2660, partial [Pseudomonadota bacterium]